MKIVEIYFSDGTSMLLEVTDAESNQFKNVNFQAPITFTINGVDESLNNDHIKRILVRAP